MPKTDELLQYIVFKGHRGCFVASSFFLHIYILRINLRCLSIHSPKLTWPFWTNYCDFIFFLIKFSWTWSLSSVCCLCFSFFLFFPSSLIRVLFFSNWACFYISPNSSNVLFILCTPPLHLWSDNLHFNLTKSFGLINSPNYQPTSLSCVSPSLHLH